MVFIVNGMVGLVLFGRMLGSFVIWMMFGVCLFLVFLV